MASRTQRNDVGQDVATTVLQTDDVVTFDSRTDVWTATTLVAVTSFGLSDEVPPGTTSRRGLVRVPHDGGHPILATYERTGFHSDIFSAYPELKLPGFRMRTDIGPTFVLWQVYNWV